MHISKLELFGFKSFAKKQTILLDSGVTGIVGPNGCGKTNIVDAIRWVLGEQKTSRLRSSKMEDVIFNGASNIKPLGLCEVYLTVQNDKGLLPIEYEEVEIGRRLYRNGDSEYFINRTACRLKDIYNLFVDTGMSSDAYSVIELNMIEQILSDKDDSRRSMFEEAAGVNKYKSQRRSALRKFELNSRDLERIDDIILEIEMQVKSLELQLKRFKRHEKLSSQIKDIEINLASAKIIDLERGIKPLESLLKKKNTLLKKNTSKKESESVELKDARDFYLAEKEIVEKMKVDVDNLTENLLKEVQAKNRESSKGMEVLEDELQKKISQLNKFDKDYIKIVSNNDVIKSLSNESRENFKNKNYTVIETDKKYENLKASIEDYKDKIQSYNKEKEFDFNKIDDSIKEMQKKINLHKLELRNKEQDLNQAFMKMESIRIKIDADKFNKDDIFYDIKSAEMKIAESNIKISQIKEVIKEKFGNDIKLKKMKDYSISEMTYNVEKIKRSIEAIGPINWAVSDEYEEQSKRLNILNEQRSDLLDSEKNLKDAIKKIDSVAKKQFLDTFEIIKNNFETMFGVFFSGGKGSINLQDAEDPLNSDVVIFAQPPGKKNNSLRMLSAGEKSLTAIALLFSIYQYKPSPFCILDEIDAPLDDINIKKFTDVISEYSKGTQFIMVTHNKLTMESADCIYGVTAEKKGISKVISINFAEK
ncbi:AAA family ATPase [Candidatus Marinimicrobia bacterium]|nr:AAA family ATPase [Candidatus Neomarinimicrobiota bacterium]|tara:strand:- start:510 stop:2621 length:2112 start_codon:yes stop_codon:yes gene_type:complete